MNEEKQTDVVSGTAEIRGNSVGCRGSDIIARSVAEVGTPLNIEADKKVAEPFVVDVLSYGDPVVHHPVVCP